MTNRDEFSEKTRQVLARRVGYKCSNPSCRVPTSGPGEAPTSVVNIGVAAHITAASEGGPRYDSSLTTEQRQDCKNGIWLCQNCAKKIDSDLTRFSTHVLESWKYAAEVTARIELGRISDPPLLSYFQEALSIMPELLLDLSQSLKNEDTKLDTRG